MINFKAAAPLLVNPRRNSTIQASPSARKCFEAAMSTAHIFGATTWHVDWSSLNQVRGSVKGMDWCRRAQSKEGGVDIRRHQPFSIPQCCPALVVSSLVEVT